LSLVAHFKIMQLINGYREGVTLQTKPCIILNASGLNLPTQPSTSGLFVAPIRSVNYGLCIVGVLSYDLNTYEITYSFT